MRFFQNKRGFTLIELMIAGLVVTVGLTGVAAMQITALKGTFSANSNSTGSGIALAWAEWLNGLVSHTDQEKVVDNTTNMWTRENLRNLSRLDSSSPFDQLSVEVQLPSSTDDLVKCFNGTKDFVLTTGGSRTLAFRKEGGTPFTAADLPPPPPAGAHLVMRVAANVPVYNTATIEISLLYTNAFSNQRGATMHFVVAANN